MARRAADPRGSHLIREDLTAAAQNADRPLGERELASASPWQKADLLRRAFIPADRFTAGPLQARPRGPARDATSGSSKPRRRSWSDTSNATRCSACSRFHAPRPRARPAGTARIVDLEESRRPDGGQRSTIGQCPKRGVARVPRSARLRSSTGHRRPIVDTHLGERTSKDDSFAGLAMAWPANPSPV